MNESGLNFSENDIIASICRESFYDFVKEFWDVIIPEKPVWNWHIKYLCNEMQKVAERVFKNESKEYDLIINVPPGSTKTTICGIMFPAWVWTRMPSAGIIGCSYTYDVALDMSRKGRIVIKSEKYQQCFPEVKITSDMDAKGHYATQQMGERNTVGTDGNITGRHADFIIVDDPLNPRGARSDADILKANNFITETLWSRKKEKLITPTIIIMQRLSQNDPTGMMIEKAKNKKVQIKHICLPGKKSKDIKPKFLRKYYKNGLMDEKRLSKKVLDEWHAFLLDYGFAGQIMQNPIPAGGGMFKTERIKIDVPEKDGMRQVVRFWDKAGTEGGGKYTAGVKMGVDKRKHFWILDVRRGQWSSEVREANIKQTAEIDSRDIEVGVEQEPGSGGKESAESTIKNLAGWRTWIDKPSGSGSSKEARAYSFSAQVNIGNVSMVAGEWNTPLIDELKFWPNSTYTDQGDGCSGAFNRLTSKKRAGVFL